MIRIYQWRTRIFSTEFFIRRSRPFINQHPFLSGKKKSSNSPVGVKISDDIGHCNLRVFEVPVM